MLLSAKAFAQRSPQRVVVVMCDGFGIQYMEQSHMPVLAQWRERGLFRRVKDTMPSVTNTNNASICCGVLPDQHGITGNSYFDERSGREEYMETADLLLAPGADLILSAETPSEYWVKRMGPAPDIYSREINYWLLTAAIDLLKNCRDLGCLYVHTTDYPMHAWPPEAAESQEHLTRLDQLLGEAAAAAPDAAFLLTADHGMNHKTRCWDLEKACARRGTPIRIAISVERDRYPKHHRGHGGVAWVYCNRPNDIDVVSKTLSGLKGVEAILTRSEGSKRYHLMASRIGDLVVLGDRDTVFGQLEAESEPLPPEYRAHGSLYEMDVPLIIHNANARLSEKDFQYNWHLARWLYS